MIGRRIAARGMAMACATLLVTGCISADVDEAPPDFSTMLALRAKLAHPVASGPFTLANPALQHAINIRGSTIHPPKGQSFADVLQQAIDTQLKAAGKLDPAATVHISGVLTDSGASENIAHGHAKVGADITVLRNGKPAFTRHYEVVSAWDSSFIGAIAIPDAFIQYNGLYAQLSRKIMADDDLIAALNGLETSQPKVAHFAHPQRLGTIT